MNKLISILIVCFSLSIMSCDDINPTITASTGKRIRTNKSQLYEEGVLAFKANIDISNNPYLRQEGPYSGWWSEGWTDAKLQKLGNK